MKTVIKLVLSLAGVAACSLLLLAPRQARATEVIFTNEFWISTNTNTLNLGTLANPFDGSTQAKFDSVMNTLADTSVYPVAVIHILAGTYQTLGGYYINGNHRILGAGMDQTILQYPSSATNEEMGIANRSWVPQTNMEIADLTVDCNYSGGPYNRHGVFLYGAENAVRRVKVINAAKYSPNLNSEAWGIVVANSDTKVSPGNVIEDCEVSHFLGGTNLEGISSIAMYGWVDTNGTWYPLSGRASHNKVLLPNFVSGAFAYSMGNSSNLLVDQNFAEGGCGFYTDTGYLQYVTLAHNTFLNCDVGLLIRNSRTKDLTYEFNHVELLTNTNTLMFGFSFQETNRDFENILFMGNTVVWGSQQQISLPYDSINCENVTGLTIANNTLDSRLQIDVSNNTNLNVYDNFDLQGNFLTNVNQINPGDGKTRTKITSSYSAAYDDHYLGVNGAGVTVTLPLAVGYSGKELIVADESGNAGSSPITIARSSSDTINGGTSVTINSAYGAKVLTSDGTSWFAR